MEITKVGTADLLIKIGVRADLLGFEYMVDILEICLQDPNLIHGGKMKLYKMVSAKHNVSYINVESRIRNAIEITFEQGDTEELYRLFGNSINKDKAKPTTKQFISVIKKFKQSGFLLKGFSISMAFIVRSV